MHEIFENFKLYLKSDYFLLCYRNLLPCTRKLRERKEAA